MLGSTGLFFGSVATFLCMNAWPGVDPATELKHCTLTQINLALMTHVKNTPVNSCSSCSKAKELPICLQHSLQAKGIGNDVLLMHNYPCPEVLVELLV